jgi:WD40 repeat protein
MEASKVTRWVRDGLLQDKSIDFTPEAVRRIVVSDQGQVISSALRWNRIVNYSSDSHQPVSIIAGHDGRVSSCLYLSNSKRLITTSWDGSVSMWDVADGSLKSRRYDHGAPITSAAVSRDDQYLVTGARDGTLMVWNLADGATAGPFSVARSPILHLSLNADAGQVLALSADHQAIRVNRETGEPMPIDLHAEKIEWAEFSPDGSSLLVVPFGEPSQAADTNADSTESQTPTNIVLIVPVDGTAITRLEYPQPVSTSHFHPDSERIVTTTRTPDAATVWIQIARSRQTEQRFDYEDGDVFGAVFDPAGEFVYVQEFNAGSIWRVSDGRKWLTVEDASVDHPWRHTVDPFAAGPLKRLFVRRFDTAEYRDLPLDPGKEASGNLPRPLSKAERKRFLIQD